MKYINSFTFLTILLFTSCDSNIQVNKVDELGGVEVTFKATYGSENFVLNNIYDYNGDKIRISNLQFFVSELSLGTDVNGSEIDEVKLVDFSQVTTPALSAEGIVVAGNSSIPVGDYPGLSLGVGVIPDLNSDTPAEFSNGHALSETAMYWEDWNSYIFLKLEGTMDTNDDGIFDDVSFVYHVGSDPTYESVYIANNISLLKDETVDLEVELDIEKLFLEDGQYLDIAANPRIHNINQLETGHYLMDNFVNALTIQ